MMTYVAVSGRLRRGVQVLGLTGGAAFALACSGPPDNQFDTLTLPDQMSFPVVSDALEIRCGTVDCHGSLARNMRLYGHYGLRANKMDVTGIQDTTQEEYDDNFESVVTIQPEGLSAIVTRHGQGIEHWIVVTKGTGAEHHKGGSRFAKGDPTYTCLLSWLQGSANMDACVTAANVLSPYQPMSASDGTPPQQNGNQP